MVAFLRTVRRALEKLYTGAIELEVSSFIHGKIQMSLTVGDAVRNLFFVHICKRFLVEPGGTFRWPE